jgi:hypothetical protein
MSGPSSPTPVLSLIALTDGSYEACRRSLGFVRGQPGCEQVELILIGRSVAEMDPDLGELGDFGSYRILEVGDFEGTGVALAAGVRAARAPHVTYLEEHDYVGPDYLTRIIDTISTVDAPVIGVAMLPANPGLVAWCHMFLQFGEVIAPAERRAAFQLGGHHAIYRRETLLGYGDMLEAVLNNENIIFEDVRKRGETVFLAGDIVVEHVQVSRLGTFIRHEFIGQRIYGAGRAHAQNWSLGKRLLYAAAFPLIPFIRVRRGIRHIRRTGRSADLMPQVPVLMFAAACAGALGEAIGYLFGSPVSLVRERSAIELDRYAYVTERDQKAMRSAPGK